MTRAVRRFFLRAPCRQSHPSRTVAQSQSIAACGADYVIEIDLADRQIDCSQWPPVRLRSLSDRISSRSSPPNLTVYVCRQTARTFGAGKGSAASARDIVMVRILSWADCIRMTSRLHSNEPWSPDRRKVAIATPSTIFRHKEASFSTGSRCDLRNPSASSSRNHPALDAGPGGHPSWASLGGSTHGQPGKSVDFLGKPGCGGPSNRGEWLFRLVRTGDRQSFAILCHSIAFKNLSVPGSGDLDECRRQLQLGKIAEWLGPSAQNA